VRPIKNGSPHGAPFNHNTALKAARGEWIKILEDYDVQKPNCLEVLANIVKEGRDVVAKFAPKGTTATFDGFTP
jgi:hypothetical protein